MVKGHTAWPRTDVPETPITKVKIGAGSIRISTLTAMGSNLYNGTFSPQPDAHLTINHAPLKAELHICPRCLSVFWNVGVEQVSLCDTKMIPELADYTKWKKRNAWEEGQRGKNDVAGKLYKQYQMALKLGYTDDADDDAE